MKIAMSSTFCLTINYKFTYKIIVHNGLRATHVGQSDLYERT